jgi:TetR/AcrR family transcriptional regulator, regulator of biofilm formation and stress response
MASARRDDLAGVGNQLTTAARRPIEFFVKLISSGTADVPIETCAALIDGITLMYATGQAPKPTTDQVSAVLRAIL